MTKKRSNRPWLQSLKPPGTIRDKNHLIALVRYLARRAAEEDYRDANKDAGAGDKPTKEKD